jgi:hypothetical protein
MQDDDDTVYLKGDISLNKEKNENKQSTRR